jgi:ElaB/YqjD/DUF883 family membrane-anchored ribosome-binding protein
MEHTAEHTAAQFARAKGRIADDLKALVDDGEELLKATANASGERIAAVRTQFAAHASSVKARLAELSRPLVERAGRVDDYVRYYVRANPWAALGVAAAAGALIGFLAAKR